MSMSLEPGAVAAPLRPELLSAVRRDFARRKARMLALPLLLVAYLCYVFIAFDVASIAGRLRPENALTLLGDFWSYKTHVVHDARSGALSVAIEGEAKGRYRNGTGPDWVQFGAETVIDLPGGSRVIYAGDTVQIDRAGYGRIGLHRAGGKIAVQLPEGAAMPGWISASDKRVAISAPWWRVSMTPSRTETLRYQPGWELFFFTLDSPFHGKSLAQLVGLAALEPRLDPAQSNLRAMVQAVWTNRVWHHGEVIWAIGETLLMAFLGTMTAALLAFPLAFLAAANFAPTRLARLTLRRFFDFLRGVDGLIWTVLLSRAYGPGPLTGALAIFLTDTGSFGKTFSEALENIDGKQLEGVASTGANAVQRARFGVVPQVAPVILSQVLYYLESNTRSATIIGAIVGGGIGLLLTQAILTQKDWEEVCYYIVLIVAMVMAMDSFSGWLRRRFIKG